MITNMHIAIVGGDARQIEVIRTLSELDAKISLIGFDQLDSGFVGVMKHTFVTIDPSSVDAIILPVSGISEDGLIESVFSGKEVVLTKEWLEKTPKHAVIYSGICNDALKRLSKELNRVVVPYIERDDVAIYNSIPTAEGTLMIVIQNTDFTIHNANVIITGFGRIGMTLCRVFNGLGANVEVITNEGKLMARAFEMQLKCYPVSALVDRARYADIVINTIPAKVIDANVLSKLPAHALVVDLASKPGGTDFRYAKKRGIKALHILGLPAMVAPKTAGQIIASVLGKMLLDHYGKIKGGNS